MLSNSELYGKSQSFWRVYSEKLTWTFIMVFLLIFPLFVDGTGYAKITEAKYHFCLDDQHIPRTHLLGIYSRVAHGRSEISVFKASIQEFFLDS